MARWSIGRGSIGRVEHYEWGALGGVSLGVLGGGALGRVECEKEHWEGWRIGIIGTYFHHHGLLLAVVLSL